MDLKNAWVCLASELGLEFQEGIEGFFASPGLATIVGGEIAPDELAQIRRIMSNTLMRTLMSSLFIGVASGSYRGFEVNLCRNGSRGRHSAHYVNLALFFPSPFHAGLEVRAATGASRFWRRIRPGGYVRVPGDQEFDLKVSARADDRDAALIHLSDAGRREALVSLWALSPSFVVRDLGILWREPGNIIEAARARELLDRMALVAQRFS